MRPIRTFAAGASYVLAYVCVTAFGPTPSSASRPLFAFPLLLVPSIVGLVLTARAARASHGAERTFWRLFALACGAHALSQAAFLVEFSRESPSGMPSMAGHLGHYGFPVLSMVALMVRPHRPRTSRAATTAAVEWMMALAGFYFLLFYFVLAPAGSRPRSGSIVLALQEALPAAAAVLLAWTAPEPPFREVYRSLAAGFGGAVVLNSVASWLGLRGGIPQFEPRDAIGMLPFVGIAVAATCPRGPFWAGAASPPGRGRGWLAALALVLPPLLDLATRAFGWQPDMAAQRSQATLVAVVLMCLLLAWRLREAPAEGPSPGELADGPAARAARTAHLAFASGVSHELNNPLMAVAGWAEVVQSRGETDPSVARLLDAAREAAAAVSRLQRVVAAGVGEPARPRDEE